MGAEFSSEDAEYPVEVYPDGFVEGRPFQLQPQHKPHVCLVNRPELDADDVEAFNCRRDPTQLFSAEVLKTRLGYLFLLKSAEDGSVLYQSDSVAEWQQVGSNPRSQVVFLSAAGKSEDGKKLYNIHPAGDSDWSMNQFFCLGVGQGNGQDEEGKPEGHNFAYVRCNLDDMSQRFALDFGGTSAGDSARVSASSARQPVPPNLESYVAVKPPNSESVNAQAALVVSQDAPAALEAPPVPLEAPPMPVNGGFTPVEAPPVPVEAPVEAPQMPVEAPLMPVEAPLVPMEAPPMPVEAPLMPRDMPPVPVEAPPVRLEAPSMPVEAPPVPMEAPLMPRDMPPVPVEAPPVRLEAPSMPVEAPPVPMEAPPMPVEALPVPMEAPPMPLEAPVPPIVAPPRPMQDAPPESLDAQMPAMDQPLPPQHHSVVSSDENASPSPSISPMESPYVSLSPTSAWGLQAIEGSQAQEAQAAAQAAFEEHLRDQADDLQRAQAEAMRAALEEQARLTEQKAADILQCTSSELIWTESVPELDNSWEVPEAGDDDQNADDNDVGIIAW